MKTFLTIPIAFLVFASAKANNTPPAGTTAAVLTASVNNNTVVLNWSSAASNFEVERSFYSNGFTTISAMNMPFINNAVNNFRVSDNAAELAERKVAYYRIKQTNANGTVTYSNTMAVSLNGTAPVAPKTTFINFTAAQNGNAVITVKSVTGQTMIIKSTVVSTGNNIIELGNIGNKGIYTATIAVNGVEAATQKLIIE